MPVVARTAAKEVVKMKFFEGVPDNVFDTLLCLCGLNFDVRFPNAAAAREDLFETLTKSSSNKLDLEFSRLAKSVTRIRGAAQILVQFCKLYNLNIKDDIRIVDAGNFAQIRHHYDWHGALFEGYRGNVLSVDIDARREFIVHIPLWDPAREAPPRSSLDITIRNTACR